MTSSFVSQGASLSWSPERRITKAAGAVEAVLERSANTLLNQPLHEALSISPEQAAALDVKARGGGAVEFVMTTLVSEESPAAHETAHTYLRLELSCEGATATAHVQNMSALLKGAPPLQISRLSSSLSHELRNPLSSVKMAVQTLARNSDLSEKDQRRLVIAQREIRTIERMLWMLSEYGRDTPPHIESIALKGLVQQSLEMIDRELGERQAKVVLEEPEPSPRVKTDSSRMRPVLAQLLWNVIIGLEASAEVKVKLSVAEGQAQLEILDPTSTLLPTEQVFEPFGSRLARGAGLSLAALNQVMIRQGGKVSARAQGSGTVFTLTFPLA